MPYSAARAILYMVQSCDMESTATVRCLPHVPIGQGSDITVIHHKSQTIISVQNILTYSSIRSYTDPLLYDPR